MILYLTDTVDTDLKQMAELNGNICVTSGIDELKFVNPSNGTSGSAGIDLAKDYWDAPTFNSEGVGTMDNTKWYSIALLPISSYIADPNTGSFMRGALSHYSAPYQTTAVSKSIVFDLPELSDQKIVFAAGYATGGDPTTLIDSTRTWTVDSWVDYQVINHTTGEIATILSNTADTLTLDGDVTATDGDGYHIIKDLITNYEVYGIELNQPEDVLSGQFNLQGYADAVDATFELTDFSASLIPASDTNYPPDPYFACTTADNRLICGGGVEYSDGTVAIDQTETTSTADITFPIAISKETEYAVLVGTGSFSTIMRYTFSDASQYMTGARQGSTVTVTLSEDAGNDVTSALITDVASDGSWIEIANADGVANADDETISIAMQRNVLVGTDTTFGLGMVNAQFKFVNDADPYYIAWVDVYNQEIGLRAAYIGQNIGVATGDYRIYSDYGLAWSDAGYPHIFRTENYTPVSDRIMSISAFNQTIILFCKNSVQAVPIAGLGQTPYLISDDVQCRAPHSVVSTPGGVFFYDGSGISLTDGQQIVPVTAYRAQEYLGYVNNNNIDNMRGVYDPQNRRIEYYFAYADEENNNYGLTISTDSLNCYPSQRMDVNAAWLDRNEVGDQVIVHGTTDDIGDGSIWIHEPSTVVDGGYDQELVGNITAVDTVTRTLTVDMGVEIDDLSAVKAGAPALFFPSVNGTYFQLRIVSIVQVGVTTAYTIVADDDCEIDEIEVGDTLVIGGVPFDYGVKWTDFASPQYAHKVRQLHIDVTGLNGMLFVEHYRNMNDTPNFITTHFINSGDTKIISQNKAGDCFEYGFRIYGVSMTKFEFHSFEILFDTER